MPWWSKEKWSRDTSRSNQGRLPSGGGDGYWETKFINLCGSELKALGGQEGGITQISQGRWPPLCFPWTQSAGPCTGPQLCSLCVKTCAFGQSRGWDTQTWLRTEGGEELAQATSVRGWGWGKLGGRRHLERWLHESACQAWFQDSRQLAIRLSLESRVESRKRILELSEGCQEGSSRCECVWASVQVSPGSLASPPCSPSWPQAGLTRVSTILCRPPSLPPVSHSWGEGEKEPEQSHNCPGSSRLSSPSQIP